LTDKRLPATALDERLARLRDTYGDSSAEMAAKRDQERARLLAECGWTTRELAERLGKSQVWVVRQTQFGRFLFLIPAGIKISECSKFARRAMI
jgi:hypothetical protein